MSSSKTYPFITVNQTLELAESDMNPQVGHIDLNINITPSVYEGIVNKYLLFSFQGSKVAASNNGELKDNESARRGWFLEQVEVQINPEAAYANAFAMAQDAPTTTSDAKSVTSSVGLSISGSVGAFGKTPTANVSAGLSINNSFTEQLEDFKINNISTNAEMKHEYYMASSSGAPYSEPLDLVNNTVTGQLKGDPLYEVPDLAICNFPLASQAIFMTTGSEELTDKVVFEIYITAVLRYIHKYHDNPVHVSLEDPRHMFNIAHKQTIDFSQYKCL